ncbi:dolichol phosphate-mannose biosynthesis regulatory protein-like isoform X2 [Liolophura sinensis]|uniref:dolichol phosphate-mannose biosynthesis regulatory protein-like isoform X2 n=1 Tax=Liolophura sinensis TaxID=3198878 RepID=UPI0031582BE5
MNMVCGDQVVGYGLVTFAGLIFTYYTLWVIILPFVDENQDIHRFFLPRTYALSLPLIAGVIALVCIGAFVVTLKMKAKKKKTG